ncbi:MAG: putative CRISPR-associated protein [Trueperaceae bacterium]|nr:putative CRISPR-associated protein [Trueperaceae bacterium]
MARHLIASVGTSLLINWRKASQSSARPEAEELTGWIANQDPKSASAETNTLMLLDAGKNDCITFIHSDTLEGELCARVLSSHYETRCRGAEAKVAKGLGRQPKSFENGLKEMVQVVKDAETAAAAAGNTPVLCVTGGFKAQTAVLTAYAMLKQIPAHYVHEDATGLLTLPKLPIAWSTSTGSENSKFFEVLDDAEATAATKAGIVKAHQNLEDLVIRDEAEVPT